nr:B-lymphocyte antigen CD20-like isoform X1 [Equus asinus]XP_044606250.1 B-lymphocyte antigen CD20-like isoform X1 [Equus asinus]
MQRRYALRVETRALGAAQILLGFFHCALGILCECLFIREAGLQRVGYIPTFVIIIYAFWSAPYYITSGAISVAAQRKGSQYQCVSGIVMNILSACFAALGAVALIIACASFQSEEDYTWTQLAGTMLLHYLLFIAVSELIIASITIHWIVQALQYQEYGDESSSLSEFSISS